MKSKLYDLKFICLLSILVIVDLSAFSQNAGNDKYIQQLEKVFQTLNTTKPFSLDIGYYEISGSGISTMASSGKYYQKGKLGRYVFEEYDQMVNKSFYVKLDHVEKKMIIVENTAEENVNIDEGQALAKFNSEYFSVNGYVVDSSLSDLDKGLISLNSLKNPYYHKIELRYDPANNYPVSYTLYFRQGLSQEIAAYQVQFSNINFSDFDKEVLDEKIFFTKKGSEFIASKKYQSYEIVNL